MSGRYFERFGGGNFLFPMVYTCDSTIIPEQIQIIGIKCFQDDSLYYNPTVEGCQDYLTQVELSAEELSVSKIVLKPNPAINEIQLVGINVKSVRVNSASGELQMTISPQ